MQTFELVFALDHIGFDRLLEVDESLYLGPRVSIVAKAEAIANDWAKALSTVSLAEVLGHAAPIGQVQLLKPVYAMNAFAHNLMVAQLGFQGSQMTQVALMQAIQSSLSLYDWDRNTTCARAFRDVGVDFCAAVTRTTPHHRLSFLKVEMEALDDERIFPSVMALTQRRRKLAGGSAPYTLAPTSSAKKYYTQYQKYFDKPWAGLMGILKNFKDITSAWKSFRDAQSVQKATQDIIDEVNTLEKSLLYYDGGSFSNAVRESLTADLKKSKGT